MQRYEGFIDAAGPGVLDQGWGATRTHFGLLSDIHSSSSRRTNTHTFPSFSNSPHLVSVVNTEKENQGRRDGQ